MARWLLCNPNVVAILTGTGHLYLYNGCSRDHCNCELNSPPFLNKKKIKNRNILMETILQGLRISSVCMCGIFAGIYSLAHMERFAAHHRDC